MLIVHARVRVPESQRDVLIEKANAVIGPSRADAGCIEYSLYADITDPGHFIFYEEWDTLDDLKAHLSTDHVREFAGWFDAAGFARPEIRIVDPAELRPL